MEPVLLRVILVVSVVCVAVAVARLSRPLQDTSHPPLNVTPNELPAGAVLFTSVDCDQCKTALAALRRSKIQYREVTWEIEGERLARWGVQAVPLLAVVDEVGSVLHLAAGVPTKRALRNVAKLQSALRG